MEIQTNIPVEWTFGILRVQQLIMIVDVELNYADHKVIGPPLNQNTGDTSANCRHSEPLRFSYFRAGAGSGCDICSGDVAKRMGENYALGFAPY